MLWWVGGCSGSAALTLSYTRVRQRFSRSLGRFSPWPGTQICPEGFDIACVSSSHCTVCQSPIQQASTSSTQLMLTSGRWASLWVQQQKKTSPLRKSAQMESICVTGRQFSSKRKTGPPISRDSVRSSCQRPQTATSAVGRCGRGPSPGAPGGRPLRRNCSPPFRCILTLHSAPGDHDKKR